MASLADQIDRLSRNAKSIKSIATKIGFLDNRARAAIAGPFTQAVLYKSLGDLIRDIDPSELGLFNLVAPSGPSATRSNERDPRGSAHREITRVEFPGATPLRQPTRKDETQRSKELEPEVYAQAALKYLDRYEPLRPMPRAHARVTSIIEQVAAVRDSMNNLTIALEEITSSDAHISPKERADEEESRIQEMKARILELRKRKEAMLKRPGAKSSRPIRTATRQKPEKERISSPPSSPPKQDAHEEAFWSTPGATARTLRFDNLLKDEFADLQDVSMSFSSPVASRTTTSPPSGPSRVDEPSPPLAVAEPANVEQDKPPEWTVESDQQEFEQEDDMEDEEDDDEKTIVLKVKPAPFTPESAPPQPVTPPTVTKSPVTDPGAQPETPSGTKRLKVRVNSEVERIVSKIWSTVGEIIKPGHSFSSSGSPRAKETIAHLQSLAAQTPAPMSPSISSESSLSVAHRGPTSQQILTAHLLLVLLSSTPSFSLPLNRVKEELASKAGGNTTALGVGSTRVLYGCVAKRLVKIERGGGEQVVKFDL